MLRIPALATIGLAVVTTSATAAGPPILPLSQVQPGMACTAASVVRGTVVSAFDAHVDDVLPGTAAGQDARILLTVSGPAVDATGIGPGFSGSPVSCIGGDGVPRIIGAISESIGAYGGRTVLATPIEMILGEPVDPPVARTAGSARAAAIRRAARPTSEPLSIGGLAPAVGRAVQRAARRSGRVLTLAPAARAAQVSAATPLVPGSALAASLATGDVEAGSIGTVSYVDGDRVWAFGHPLDGAGRRGLFLSSAYVFTVVSNPNATDEQSTYKLAAPVQNLGTVRQDGVSAIAGRLGGLPAAYPLHVTTRDLDTGRLRSLNADLVDEHAIGLPTGVSALTTVAPLAVATATYTTLDGAPVRQSADLCMRAFVRGRRAPLLFCNAYVGGGGNVDRLLGGPMIADVSAATQMIDAYDAGPLNITRVSIGLRLRRGVQLGTLTGLTGPRAARRGRTIRVRARLRLDGGGRATRTLRVRLPRRMPAGRRDLELTGVGPDAPSTGDPEDVTTIDVGDLFDDSGDAPPPASSLDELSAELASLHRYDGVTARFLRPGADARGRLPGGAEGVAQQPRRIGRDPALRIAGSARLTIRVR